MNNENEKLLQMLKSKKISEEEYKLLTKAMGNKPSYFKGFVNLLINPFQKIAGLYALLLGFGVLLGMSFLGLKAQIYFTGILDAFNASVLKNPMIKMSFLSLLYQNCVNWLVLSVIFILIAKIAKQKGTRVIDFFGTVAFARFPYLLLAVYLWIMRVMEPQFMDMRLEKIIEYSFQLTPLMIFFSMVTTICVIWQLSTYFHALKISSGIKGKGLWISFIIAMVLGEMISNAILWPSMQSLR